MPNKSLNYPLVFVHGMFGWGENEGINRRIPYWGATSGSILEFLRGMGYECFAASVGPMSSAWDQACELYAQLKGTRVDYGKAHSRKHGHKQFGRSYAKPLFDGWSSSKKVHLIGHSFGGNVIRLLVHLLAYGAPEEVTASGKEVSELFKGGNDELVYSVTAICTPLRGTAAYEVADKYKLVKPIKSFARVYSCVAGRSPFHGKLIDFHLEHFGISNTPGLKDAPPYFTVADNYKKTIDHIAHDLSPEGANALNDLICLVPNIYYFSFPFDAVDFNKKINKHSAVNSNFFFLKLTSNLMLKNSSDCKTGNDGLVDVSSACCPPDEPSVIYINGDKPSKGIWNVMPIHTGDHGTPIGLFADRQQLQKFYLEIVSMLNSVHSDDEREKIHFTT